MNVVMIDPWGNGNLELYTNGLCEGLSKNIDLTLFTNSQNGSDSDRFKTHKIFFHKSQNMKNGKLRKIVRGLEYISSYLKIFRFLSKNRADVIHIQWLLMYRLDALFLKIMKKKCDKIIYTAHNVLPHINGKKAQNHMNQIYGIVDKIVLHGKKIEKEFLGLFPDFEKKVIIQKHGVYFNQNTLYKEEEIEEKIISKVAQYDKILIFFGFIFYNKGIDRLIKIWMENYKDSNHLLVVAGKVNEEYKEYTEAIELISDESNILLINRFIEENLLNFLVTQADIIVLPYRHASMSGVVFTASEFRKTILSTDVGSISEYLINEENAFIINNDDEILKEKLDKVLNELSKVELKLMGDKLNESISKNYSWEEISINLINEAYKS